VKARDFAGWLRDTVLRLLPHAAPRGLERIGRPGPTAPVLVTGNFTVTVRRVKQTLAGRDAWLLVANSNGINVWCAAGGGHLTHHDVIAAIRASRIGQLVGHRTLVLPQLSARSPRPRVGLRRGDRPDSKTYRSSLIGDSGSRRHTASCAFRSGSGWKWHWYGRCR
jgi:CO dehydrogenase/acetyl-CoA synthase gamma subunit (corrinoid Fe-S protein)